MDLVDALRRYVFANIDENPAKFYGLRHDKNFSDWLCFDPYANF